MSRPPPLVLYGGGAPLHASSSPADELARLHIELDEARNVVNGAEALVHVLSQQGDAASRSLPDALALELDRARALIPILEDQINTLETRIAAAVPAPLSPAPPPASAIANGFGALSSDAYSPNSPASGDRSGSGGSPAFPPALSVITNGYGPLEQVQTLLDRLGAMDQVAERVRAMDTVVDEVERHPQLKFELSLEEYLPSVMACLSESSGKEVRAAVYRLFRHLIVDASDIVQLNERHLPLFLVRSLARDSKHDLEKEHALRLVRVLISHAGAHLHGQEIAPVAVLRAVVALAETSEEKLRLAALETLGELVIRNLPLLVACEGLRVVLQTLSDGPHDLAAQIALTFISAVDHPETRQWLRPGVDLEIILAGFTEVHGKGAVVEERVKASANIVATFLKSWSGLFYLNIHGRQALTSLVDSLTNPSRVIRETLLDMLFSVFNVKTPAWHAARSKRPSIDGASSDLERNGSGTVSSSAQQQQRTNLIDQYMAVLLLVFFEAGLIEALASLAAEREDPSTACKVSLLIGEVLDLANRVLPPAHATRVQALPKLFALTASFDTSDARLAASDALLKISALNRMRETRAEMALGGAVEENRPRSDSLEDPSHKRTLQQRVQVESAKLSAALSIDDLTFRNLLLSSGVLTTKEESKWNLDAIETLLEGPLRNPKRLEEAIRATKFVRRLVAVFQPFSLRYSDWPKDQDSTRWTQVGCTLVRTLVSSPDGVAYLAEDKLLRQIADCLFQLDPSAAGANEMLLSKSRVEHTLVGGYFAVLGELSKSSEGIRLLDQFKLFTAFYRVAEMRSREDLVKAILENMDYSTDGHPRVFLSKALTSSYKHIRLFATRHLSSLMHIASPSIPSWQTHLLVPQLYDSAPEVVYLALEVLEQACAASVETLEKVVEMRPALDLLGERAEGLLIQFLSIPAGVRFLDEIDFIERELESWSQERNLLYMVEVELALARALKTDGGIQSDAPAFDGTPPPHFYGQLVKTAEGCDILRESGHFDLFTEVIQQHEEFALDHDYVVQLKSVLWAVGHIGSTADGLALLYEEDVLTDMVQIAAFSPIYSLRGTATYALAFVSSTEEGAEMLDELGWESVYTPLRGPTGICVPMYLNDYIFTPLWDPPVLDLPAAYDLALSSSHLEREVTTALANLSNHILATKASKTLARLKSRHRSLFSSPALYYRALAMLAAHHYRLSVRKYIVELFDLPLDPENAARVAQAGEELRARKRALDEGGPDGTSPTPTPSLPAGFKPAPWAPAASGTAAGSILGDFAAGAGGAAADGDVVADDDDESSGEEQETSIPLQVLTPLVTVRGFLLS
ncbi:TORC2 complex subunit TSC11 [Rhodotorula paludigena]|uniref:TORC2 complex subunit TSC11 n=1 Tax=Rhodotorula paludigena TaxID=86838 RepID=UPI003180D5E7